jgi:hypothetical protein
LAAQLVHLRRVHETMSIFATRTAYSNRRGDGDYLLREHQRNSRPGTPFSRDHASEYWRSPRRSRTRNARLLPTADPNWA